MTHTSFRLGAGAALLTASVAALALSCGGGEVVCEESEVVCEGACVDTSNNVYNCGECGKKCSAGQVCTNGSCGQFCPQDQTVCNSVCRDLKADPQNCGACGNACPFGQTCVSGICAVSCPVGLLACDNKCVDPLTDRSYCGATSDCIGLHHGVVCGDGQFCEAGVCEVSCSGNLTLCDDACRDLQNDPAFCGNCQTACPMAANAAPVCVSGSCDFVCAQGFADCDQNGQNGCEADLTQDGAHCGTCGTACGTGQTCQAGVCQ